MFVDFLLRVFEQKGIEDAIVWKDETYSYRWLADRVRYWSEFIQSRNLEPGKVVALEADFSPNAVALLLSLIENQSILVPITSVAAANRDELLEIAQAEFSIALDSADKVKMDKLPYQAHHELYARLRTLNHPGLVLFSSGSTGKTKAAVHDFANLLEKYKKQRHDLRTLAFLLFDHIGGIDTLLYSLSNGSCIVTVTQRQPDGVCAAIAKYRVEVLPVTPTFLNLLLLSEAYRRYDMSSLKYITYGTEVMPESTLKKCTKIFPKVTFLQKYGTTEVGTLRSKSQSSDSLWVKIGGEGFEIRVIDGILQIKAVSAMLGYLNAPNPFTSDGWFVTGDMVMVDGEYMRILGRQSEIINVGGEKVFPAEVENVIQELDNIAEVVVFGEKNPLVGNIVCARVTPTHDEDKATLIARLKKHCRERLQTYKVPVKVEVLNQKQHSERFKKKRSSNGQISNGE